MRQLSHYLRRVLSGTLFGITSARFVVAATRSFLYPGTRCPINTMPAKRRDWKKIIVIRVDDIGDVVLTTGFLRELRRAYPAAEITLVVRTTTLNLVALCPHVDQVLGYFCPQQVDAVGSFRMAWSKFLQLLRAIMFARTRLRPLNPDAVLHPRYDVDRYLGSFLAYFSGAPDRAAFSTSCTHLKRQLTPGYDALFTQTFHSDTNMHEVERSYHFLSLLGLEVVGRRLELWWNEADRRAVAALLDVPGARQEGRLVAFGIGALSPERQWPTERFASLANELDKSGNRIVVIGGEDVSQAARLLAKGSRHVILAAGRLTLRETAALFERAQLYVGNDSGPMHIAAAAGASVVEISSFPKTGPIGHYMSPARFGPWQVQHTILQPNDSLPPCRGACTHGRPHCISQISVAMVAAAATEQIFKRGRAPKSESTW